MLDRPLSGVGVWHVSVGFQFSACKENKRLTEEEKEIEEKREAEKKKETKQTHGGGRRRPESGPALQ